MSDLVEFLRARLLDDEATGEADAFPPPGYADADRQARGVRMLAEVEAKRKLIDQHIGYYGAGDDEFWPVQTLRLLALPYADHPDYDEAWRPA